VLSIVEEVKLLSWRWSLSRLDIPSCLGFWGRGGRCSVLCWWWPVWQSAAVIAELRPVSFFAVLWFQVGAAVPLEFGALTGLQGHSVYHLRVWVLGLFLRCSGYIWNLLVARCFAYQVRLVRV